MGTLWNHCLTRLEGELPAQQFNTWIRPLQAVESDSEIRLLAPNRFVLDWVREHFLPRIKETLGESEARPALVLEIGSRIDPASSAPLSATNKRPGTTRRGQTHNLNPAFTFDNFVQGKSNQLAKAASLQVAENLGRAYNPLFVYGGVGLGKTHLMHAVGNLIRQNDPSANVVYLNSERFVSDMVKALQHNAISSFKEFYRNVDALLIDDIQFFAGKEHSQEEFFHTFNTLLENKHQVVLTCDRYPKEVKGLEERLKSRFGWGLPVAIEPPDLETRVAILMNKATSASVEIPHEVAFFISKRIHSNIRELEGALRLVVANSRFTGRPITLEYAKECLKDLIALQDKQTSVENIQKTVAEYYRIRVNDLMSAKRTRTITRPRQVAMALAKELTNHSLPEIGAAFGGRDHTTVLHACRKIDDLRKSDERVAEDFANLTRILAS